MARVFARVVGVTALVYIVLVGIEPSLARGLDPTVAVEDMDMDDEMEAPRPAVEGEPMEMNASEGP